AADEPPVRRGLEIRLDGGGAGVLAPCCGPRRVDRQPVAGERLLVTRPHRHGRVVLPPVAGHGESAQYLQSLDSLLAQARPVEHLSCGFEAGVGQERLHSRNDTRGEVPVNREVSERTPCPALKICCLPTARWPGPRRPSGHVWYGSALSSVTCMLSPLGTSYSRVSPSRAPSRARPSGDSGE